MDEETQAWCEANGFTGHTVKSLVKEEFITMQSIKAMTADVISSLDLSMAQHCLLKKAVLTAQSALSPPTTAGAGGAAVSGQLASELDALESSILALSQNKEGDKDSEKTGQGKTKSLLRAHEAIYLKPRTGKTDAKVNPLELSYSEFIAGYFSILDGLLQSGVHLQAQQLCRYLKFLSKKAIAFTTTAILQFDDEFRGMVARGEAAYDDHTSLNDLQAHHFDSSAVKTTTTRPQNRGRPRPGNSQAGGSKSFGKHCYKWNEDSNNCAGCNYTHACLVCDSTQHGAVFHRSQSSQGKKSSSN